MLETMRGQVAAYPTVQFRDLKAMDAAHNEDGFRVTLENGEAVTGTRLLLAFGVSDILPELPGLTERWGKTVIHCPYCQGSEFSGKQLGLLNLPPISAPQPTLIPEWGPTPFIQPK